MLEYIFFNQKTCFLFEKAATSSGIKTVISYEDEYYTACLSEDLEENVLEQLENYYDGLMDMDRNLAEGQEGSADNIHTAGITIQLKDNGYVYASVPPEVLARVMQSISPEDLNTLVCAITEAIEDPDERGLCQR